MASSEKKACVPRAPAKVTHAKATQPLSFTVYVCGPLLLPTTVPVPTWVLHLRLAAALFTYSVGIACYSSDYFPFCVEI
ncbi:hypothetical protein BKA64DRAFT_676118 [Cadophora sp. MPI-SDFR-AT-0126]|nr:hypothetical protein BKA64DRAFT_676118 [Leotiomycetes sp. MPI-SDFR-AT-0126]